VGLFGGDSMPLRGKGRKSQMFMTGVTTIAIGYGDISSSAIDIDLTSVAGSNTQLASSTAVKNYVDSQVSVTNMTDTTIASVGDNNHFQYDAATSKWVNKTFIDFDKIAAPSDPGTEEGRLYLKEINATNNALAVKVQKAGNIVEVELTSPGCVCECGSTDGAKDPLYDFANGKMIVELYCGHSYEMDIPNLRRIQ
jgi:hypothetical protein